MKIDLIKYMSDRMQEDCAKIKAPGPVITISREYGCPAKKIAQMLTEQLTKKMFIKGKDTEWRYITKEIMTESAKELDVDPAKIQHVFQYVQKNVIQDILSAHTTKYYLSERKILATVAKVIRNIACEGHIIIVGRGGVAITRDIQQSLHINLEAPSEWRAARTSEKLNLSIEDAKKYALEIDKKRKRFRDNFEGRNTDYTRFDVTFNCMTLSIEEIVQVILKIVEVKKLV